MTSGGLNAVMASPARRGTRHTDLVRYALRRFPDREALRYGDRSISYAEAEDQLSRWVRVLKDHGLRSTEVVAALMPNRPEAWFAQIAPVLAGGRYTALHPMGSLSDHEFICNDAEVTILIVDPRFASRAAELEARCSSIRVVLTCGPCDVGKDMTACIAGASPLSAFDPVEPDEVSWYAYTGGTTGVPKAAELTEDAIASGMLAFSVGWDLPHVMRYLATAPITHAAGLLMTPVLLSGGTVILQDHWDPELWLHLLAETKANLSLLVPTMIYSLLDSAELDGRDLSSLETIMYGASPMSPARLAEGIERIGPVFSQFYGQTECMGAATALWRHQHDVSDVRRLTSCGQPLPGVEITLLGENDPVAPGEPGEIAVRARNVMKGYLHQPDLTAQTLDAGWLRTGDVGVMDDDGFYHIVDRKKDMIVTGGFNVFPREIEDVLATHPSVAIAAVFGIPDQKWGEAVRAVVAPRPGATIDVAVLQQLVREMKGPIHVPKVIDIVEAIPTTAVGKADKKALREKHWAGSARGVN